MSYLHGIYMEITSDLHAPTCYLPAIYSLFIWKLHQIYMLFTSDLHAFYIRLKKDINNDYMMLT